MSLSSEQKRLLISTVQKEPCTVQDVAQALGVSWVTAERYVKQVEQETGEVRMKVFREGTRGALKVAYHVSSESASKNELEKDLNKQIMAGRYKHHFDFMDVYQHVPIKNKSARVHKLSELHGVTSLLRNAQEQVLIMSGTLRLLSESDDQGRVRDALIEALERKVHVKILCRINPTTVHDLAGIEELAAKYSSLLLVRHTYTPLRGIIVDGKRARFKDVKNPESDHFGAESMTVFYEIWDAQWISWLSRVYFNIWRTSADGLARKKEFDVLLE